MDALHGDANAINISNGTVRRLHTVCCLYRNAGCRTSTASYLLTRGGYFSSQVVSPAISTLRTMHIPDKKSEAHQRITLNVPFTGAYFARAYGRGVIMQGGGYTDDVTDTGAYFTRALSRGAIMQGGVRIEHGVVACRLGLLCSTVSPYGSHPSVLISVFRLHTQGISSVFLHRPSFVPT